MALTCHVMPIYGVNHLSPSVSTLNTANLKLLLNASYQHMHRVPLDMRKALLIAAKVGY